MTGDVLNSRYLASALAPLWLSSDARPELWSEVILLGGNGYDATYVFVKLLAQATRKAAMVQRGIVPPVAPAVVDFDWATTYVGPPANANIAELRTTCSNGALTWTYPNGPWTGVNLAILVMQAEQGRVWQTPAGQRISVLDDVAWEGVPVNLTSPSGVAMPTAVATPVTVPDLLSFANHLASKYKILECFYRALNIVAILAGARWSLVPLFGDFPAGNEANRQGPAQRRTYEDFNRRLAYHPDEETAGLLDARSPTAEEVAGREAQTPWQARGNDLVNAEGDEVVPSIFVGMLAFGTVFESYRLPAPRFNNWLLCHLNVIQDEEEFPIAVIKNDLLGHYRDLDLKCMAVAAMVATASTTVLIDWTMTGREVAGLSGALTDLLIELFEWAHQLAGYTTSLEASGPGSALAATIANTVRTLYYVHFPDDTFMCNAIFSSAHPTLAPPAVAGPWFMWPHHIPDVVGCLTTIAMIKELPVEFGLTTGAAVANFKHEVVMTGTPANNGYSSRLGMPEEWQRKRSGAEHYLYMPYPMLALNLIAQSLRPQWNLNNAQRICEDYCHIDYEGGENVGDVIRRELQFGQTWDQALHCYLPGTFITYSWAEDDIRALALSQADVTHQTMMYIRNLQGPLVEVGIILPGLADRPASHPRMKAISWMNDRVSSSAGAAQQSTSRVVERGQGDVLVEARVTNSRKRRDVTSNITNVMLPRKGEMGLALAAHPDSQPRPEAGLQVQLADAGGAPHNPIYINLDEAKRPRGNRRRPRQRPKGDDGGSEVSSDPTPTSNAVVGEAFPEEEATSSLASTVVSTPQEEFSYYS